MSISVICPVLFSMCRPVCGMSCTVFVSVKCIVVLLVALYVFCQATVLCTQAFVSKIMEHCIQTAESASKFLSSRPIIWKFSL